MNSNRDMKAQADFPVPEAQDRDFELLETLLWTPDAGYFVLDEHEARLENTAATLGFTFSAGKFRRQLMDACARFPAAPHRVRVLMDSAGELAIEATLREPEVSIRVGVADRPIDRSHPFLYYKTTRRQVYEEAQRAGFDDVLLYNESREITESCRANVVIEIAGRKLTPPVRCGLLGGTFRAHLLDRGEIEEDVVQVEQLGAADRVWLINSVRKWIDIDLVL